MKLVGREARGNPSEGRGERCVTVSRKIYWFQGETERTSVELSTILLLAGKVFKKRRRMDVFLGKGEKSPEINGTTKIVGAKFSEGRSPRGRRFRRRS